MISAPICCASFLRSAWCLRRTRLMKNCQGTCWTKKHEASRCSLVALMPGSRLSGSSPPSATRGMRSSRSPRCLCCPRSKACRTSCLLVCKENATWIETVKWKKCTWHWTMSAKTRLVLLRHPTSDMALVHDVAHANLLRRMSKLHPTKLTR